MAVDARRPGQRRREHGSGGGSGRRRAAAVGAVARVTQLGVDGAAALEAALLLGRQRRTAAAAAAPAARRIQNPVGDELHAARLVAVHHRLQRRRGVGNLQNVHRQHRLNHDVDVLVLRQRAIVVVERPVAGLVERLAGAQRLDRACRRSASPQRFARERRRSARPVLRASTARGSGRARFFDVRTIV